MAKITSFRLPIPQTAAIQRRRLFSLVGLIGPWLDCCCLPIAIINSNEIVTPPQVTREKRVKRIVNERTDFIMLFWVFAAKVIDKSPHINPFGLIKLNAR